jgi:hypothetical protein
MSVIALTPVIRDVSFLGYEWRELAALRHSQTAETGRYEPFVRNQL